MAPVSPVRRALKRALAGALGERPYRYLLAASKLRDLRSGRPGEPEVELVGRLVGARDSAVDIGANYGLYTYALSRAVGPQGRVWAFEPIPATVATLRVVAKVLRLSNVMIVSKGCADRSRVETFEIPLQDSGTISAPNARIALTEPDPRNADVSARRVRCELVSLDEFLPSVSRLALIKADIEGAELWAFRGAERLITEHRPTVVCEINPGFLEYFGIAIEELIAFFANRGYELYRYVDRRLVRPDRIAVAEGTNYLFIHPDRRATVSDLIDA